MWDLLKGTRGSIGFKGPMRNVPTGCVISKLIPDSTLFAQTRDLQTWCGASDYRSSEIATCSAVNLNIGSRLNYPMTKLRRTWQVVITIGVVPKPATARLRSKWAVMPYELNQSASLTALLLFQSHDVWLMNCLSLCITL